MPLPKTRITLTILLPLLWLAACAMPRKGPRKAYLEAQKMLPFDAVIVPGVPFNGKSWDSIMKARVLWSYILYKNGRVKNVIYSGAAVYTPYIEARVMGLYGQALGIPAAHIFYDTQAQHSTENVYYAYLLAKQQGFKTLLLGTDPFQSFMLKGFTRKRFGTPVYHVPFMADSLAAYNNANPSIDARSARVEGWESITQRESYWSRIRGTLGRSIPWKQYKDGKVPAL